MTQTIQFSDLANGTLTIEDASISNQGLDTRYSVTFVGKNASGYAPAFNSNFLHLLENFASTDPPTGQSVRGQLWFDTSNEDVPILRINNPQVIGGQGSEYASWRPASGIWPQSATPAAQQAGDIWVDTERGQLFINLDGTGAWTLVGPAFSSSLKTGSYPDTINDSFGTPRSIIKNYVNDNIIEIITNDSFTPQTKIDGFTTLLPGINISSNNNAGINATAYSSKNLSVTTPFAANVPANSFVRNDIDNSIQAVLTIRDGLIIGAQTAFNLAANSTYSKDFEIRNSAEAGKIDFITTYNTIESTLVTINGYTKSVGIGIGSDPPTEGVKLDVGGATKVRGILTVNGATTSTFDGNLSIAGTLSSTGTVLLRNNVNVNGTLFLNSATISNSTATFTEVTASSFRGRLFGRADNADRLTDASTFAIRGDMDSSLSGDVGFNGVGGKTYFLTATIQKSIITDRPVSATTSSGDWSTFYENDSSFLLLGIEKRTSPSVSETLVQIERKALLADLLGSIIPPGTIFPWAGSINNIDETKRVPVGWLLCDGQPLASNEYNELYKVIGTTYGGDATNFRIPDLRGRLIIGYDDMTSNNQFGNVPAGRVSGAITPGWSANSASTVSGGSSVVSLTTGTASAGSNKIVNTTSSLNVMNPYLAMNYIIKV